MDAKLTTTHRLDHLDAQRFAEMLASPAWSRFEARVQSELDRLCGTCQGHDSGLSVRRAQGGVAALRAVLSLPQQMLSEMRSPKNPSNK